MIEICSKDKCTGCGLCTNICAHHAITMQIDMHCNGHLFPKIDIQKCVDCGLCISKCPQNKSQERFPLFVLMLHGIKIIIFIGNVHQEE